MCGRAELYAPNLEQGWLEHGRITPAVAVVASGNLLILLVKLGFEMGFELWSYTNACYTNGFV